MYLGLEVIDFHTHFPTRKPMFAGMGPDHRRYSARPSGSGDAPALAPERRTRTTPWRSSNSSDHKFQMPYWKGRILHLA